MTPAEARETAALYVATACALGVFVLLMLLGVHGVVWLDRAIDPPPRCAATWDPVPVFSECMATYGPQVSSLGNLIDRCTQAARDLCPHSTSN